MTNTKSPSSPESIKIHWFYGMILLFRSAQHWPTMPMTYPHPQLVAQVKEINKLHFVVVEIIENLLVFTYEARLLKEV